MVIFEEFPEGDAYWMVKSIDRFRLPHGLSESASIDVLLQQIDPALGRRADRVSATEISRVLGIPDDGQPTFQQAKIHVGSLPAVRIGQIFQRQAYRGEFPTRTATISLPCAEKSCSAYRLDQKLPAPSGWDARQSYYVLGSRQFHVLPTWRQQQVLTAKTSDQVLAVIPRTAIFQRFYGPHSEMAVALTAGPWEMVRHRLLFEGEMENGLRTRNAVELEEWHLVLETLIPDDFRWHVALMYFDDYARTQVRRLYSDARAQQSSGDHWFCTATLPFDPRYPMQLRVKGYALAPGRDRPPSMLVTSILGATAPVYVPRLAWSRRNSGEEGDNVITVDEPGPYGGKQSRGDRQKRPPRVGSTHAPSRNGAVSGFETDSFEWIGGCEERVLPKETSKRYTGGAPPRPPDAQQGSDSTAKPVSGGQAGTSLRMAAKVRPRVQHFENLIAALDGLVKTADVQAFHIVQPSDPALRAERGGRIVWDLIERNVLNQGQKPKNRWRLIDGRLKPGQQPSGRTVLVIRVTRNARDILLFEIECRASEQGFALAGLALPADGSGDPHQISLSMLAAIVRNEGRNLSAAARSVAEGISGASGASRKHHFVVREDTKRLDPASLKRFIDHCTAA